MRIQAIALLAILAATPSLADDLDAQAIHMFEAVYGSEQCPYYAQEKPSPTRREFQVEGYSEAVTVTTVEFDCALGAYNEVQAFLIHTEMDGLRPASFATPVLDIAYVETAENRDDPAVGPVESLDIVGYKAAATLINPSIDDATGQIVTEERWRGLGDANSSGVWDLTADGYVLRSYEVDATYDGEVDRVTVLDLGQEG
ncbi:DUF1176 domain-containing protein [Paracoccus sp. 08]|uniref:DUF1176 domain-containing protein n=1 Tax=Paracoccus sp. 08 TaxID=2606624 RepID=UPI0020958BE9|nr:DUF1176 domain-containing protein [Paracoccus sp. 08]MCO6362299.1 hypothetical protein [Paracoccus sp. 08]